MSKIIVIAGCVAVVIAVVIGTRTLVPPKTKIGVSFGVGAAERWPQELVFMTERAKSLGIEIETRLNRTDIPKTQTQDCIEMINSGINVLILTPRDVRHAGEILDYAKKKNVKIISYARAVMEESFDLFIGYDTYRIGQSLGQHLTEMVFKGDIIVLKGDENDFNTPLQYYGAMKYIKPLVDSGNLKLLLDAYVPNWSVPAAKEMVRQAIQDNGGRVDAILAPNDKLAGACAEVVEELKLEQHVVITGMDAEVDAIKRLLDGKQDITAYLDLRAMAFAAVDEARNMIAREKVTINSQLDNAGPNKVNAYLINGQVVTRENIDKVMIEPGYITREALGPEYARFLP